MAQLPEGYTIRRARPGDDDAIVGIFCETNAQHHAYCQAFWDWADDAADSWRDWFLRCVSDPDALVLVAAGPDDVAVGYLLAQVGQHPPVIRDRLKVEVHDLAVADGHRGRGLGAALLHTAEADFRARGVHRMQLNVAVANSRAVAFYEREGLAPITMTMFKQL